MKSLDISTNDGNGPDTRRTSHVNLPKLAENSYRASRKGSDHQLGGANPSDEDDNQDYEDGGSRKGSNHQSLSHHSLNRSRRSSYISRTSRSHTSPIKHMR